MSDDLRSVFERTVEYPKMPSLWEDGLQSRTLYAYVSSSFLDALLPSLVGKRIDDRQGVVRKLWLLERYRDTDPAKFERHAADLPLSDDQIAEIVGRLERAPHTKLSAFGDDVVLLAETMGSWWYLHFDCDVSDCVVGRIGKGGRVTLDDLETAVVRSFAVGLEGRGRLRAELPPSILRGWVQW